MVRSFGLRYLRSRAGGDASRLKRAVRDQRFAVSAEPSAIRRCSAVMTAFSRRATSSHRASTGSDVCLWRVPQLRRQGQLSLQFEARASRNVEELKKLPGRVASGALSHIGRDRYCGPPDLRGQSKHLEFGQCCASPWIYRQGPWLSARESGPCGFCDASVSRREATMRLFVILSGYRLNVSILLLSLTANR